MNKANSSPESQKSYLKKKKPPSYYSQLGLLRDMSNHHNNNQRTSWSDLRKLNFHRNEEHDIKALLGIPQPKQKLQIREVNSLGGGGNQNIRKEITLGRLEDSRIPPSIRLK